MDNIWAVLVTLVVGAFAMFFKSSKYDFKYNKKDNSLSKDIDKNNNVIEFEKKKIEETKHQYELNKDKELTPTEVEDYWNKDKK